MRKNRCTEWRLVAGVALGCAILSPVRGQDTNVVTVKQAVAVKVAPFYTRPQADLLPSGYFNRADSCVAESVFVDTSGAAWFCLRRADGVVYSPAAHWRYSVAGGGEVSAQRSQDDTDRNRRLRVLQQHRDWPRRIIKAVRDGTICVDMTAEQLCASWNEPSQKSRSFTLGLGEYETWFFTEKDGKLLMVALTDGRVIGWSLGEGK